MKGFLLFWYYKLKHLLIVMYKKSEQKLPDSAVNYLQLDVILTVVPF